METSTQYINILSSVRKRLGLTQEEMGRRLGVSKSMVKLVETNQRCLATYKVAKLAMLESQLAALQRNNKIELLSSANEVYSAAAKGFEMDVQYPEVRCIHSMIKLTRQLQKMQRQHEVLRAGIYSLDVLRAIRSTDNLMIAKIVLDRPKLLKKLTKCNGYAQEMLKKKIAVLHAEAILYQRNNPDYVHIQ